MGQCSIYLISIYRQYYVTIQGFQGYSLGNTESVSACLPISTLYLPCPILQRHPKSYFNHLAKTYFFIPNIFTKKIHTQLQSYSSSSSLAASYSAPISLQILSIPLSIIIDIRVQVIANGNASILKFHIYNNVIRARTFNVSSHLM